VRLSVTPEVLAQKCDVYVEKFVDDKSIPVIEYAAVYLLIAEMLVFETWNGT
jgi:hypothetical protein